MEKGLVLNVLVSCHIARKDEGGRAVQAEIENSPASTSA
jgi:hypothetical protein